MDHYKGFTCTSIRERRNKTKHLGRSPQKQTTNQKKKSYLHRTKKKDNFETLNREIKNNGRTYRK